MLALGSNIDPERNLPAALDRLSRRLDLQSVSRAFETRPAQGARGPVFWNAAARIETSLAPAELKAVLRAIEAELGRVRGQNRNAPRTIDLDITLYGQDRIVAPEVGLRIPDPDLERWPHVALPAADLAPDWIHPVSGRALRDIALAMARAEGVRRLPRAEFDPADFASEPHGM